MKKSLSILALIGLSLSAQAQMFALKNGDRVVFYGDSITDGGPYTAFAEAFVRLRYPDIDVRFFNAGVGGDRVTGGWMGPIDERMTRDLFSRKPTVITVMLGMNDGSYQAAKDEITNAYQTGYKHMIDRFKKETPTARVFLIKPSPFDDVTRAPGWPGGYNGVMMAYASFVEGLAKDAGYASVDFNTPVVKMLEKAKALNADQSTKIIGDRVHPGPAGHLIMAEQLLLSWGATPAVSNVTIDATSGKVNAYRANVSDLKMTGSVVWNQLDAALPFPIDRKDANFALVMASSDFDEKLNQQMITVKNLKAGNYTLKIDDKAIANYTADELAVGVNIAKNETPMIAQARTVMNAVNQRTNLMYQSWRQIEFTLGWASSPKRDAALKSLAEFSDDIIAKTKAAAKPTKHKFEIVSAG